MAPPPPLQELGDHPQPRLPQLVPWHPVCHPESLCRHPPNQPKRSGSHHASQPPLQDDPLKETTAPGQCADSACALGDRRGKGGGRRSLKPLSDAPSTSLPRRGSTTDLIRPTVSGPAGLQASGAPLSPPPGNVRERGVTAFPIPAGIRREEADHPNPSPLQTRIIIPITCTHTPKGGP